MIVLTFVVYNTDTNRRRFGLGRSDRGWIPQKRSRPRRCGSYVAANRLQHSVESAEHGPGTDRATRSCPVQPCRECYILPHTHSYWRSIEKKRRTPQRVESRPLTASFTLSPRFPRMHPRPTHPHVSGSFRNEKRTQRQKTEDEAESEDDAIEDRFTKVNGKGTARRRPLPGSDSDAASSSSDGGFSEEEEKAGEGGQGDSDSDGPVSSLR